ncbi:MAG TPA: hypothetical protein VNT26_12070, partial [Candidatus Sulfotelmatobacter sp.]|nr:hypothetical protein [Candidatus Sulfotelmatobacter sp.]
IRQRIELASVALAVLCFLLLGLGTWQKLSLLSRKQALLTKVQAAQKAVEEHDTLTGILTAEYENLRHLFVGQQNTLDTLRTLQLLQQSRINQNFWYVLVADQQSYFSRPATVLLATNRPAARTNLIGGPLDTAGSPATVARTPGAVSTNASPAKPGLIAELCVPGEAEAARRLLSQVVNHLKKQPLFAKVDLLSDDLRRSLADPKVIVPDRHFVLALDFAETDFQQAVRWKKPAQAPPPRPTSKRTARAILGAPQPGDQVAQTTSPEPP